MELIVEMETRKRHWILERGVPLWSGGDIRSSLHGGEYNPWAHGSETCTR